ncbi:MAG TPA: VWA domain-containing protein [Candidatus Aquilonibacter sp.]|nr:VWA domain-containing protein [Candidatus Aquilonibacter sp.]
MSSAALSLALLLQPALNAQQPAQPLAGAPIRSTSSVVNIYATVRDRHGRLISNLDRNDFALTEDGARQQIQFFSRETNVPLSLGVLIDTSPSQGRLLADEQHAAKFFLSKVLQNTDQAFVVHFDVDVEVLQDFTNTPALLATALDQMRINNTGESILPESSAHPHQGGTRLYDALYLASNELMKTRYGRKVVVMVTDGEDQGSTVDWRESLEAAERADVIVYSIIITDPDFYLVTQIPYRGSEAMQKLSLATGGHAIRVASVHNIGAAFDEIAAELRSEYLISYVPSSSHPSPGFRQIRLRIPAHNYTVRARSGYYSPAE